MSANNNWQEKHNNQLSELMIEGKEPEEIALIMGVSAKTIKYKSLLLERRKGDVTRRKKRTCLGGCKKVFMSAGPGNRICPNCKKQADRTGVITSVSLHLNTTL